MIQDVNGVGLVSDGGVYSAAVAAGTATDTVIKGSAGRLCKVLVTSLGTNALSVYDNNSVGSGLIVGQLPASAPVGSIYSFQIPSVSGITVGGNPANPGVTLSYD